MTYLADAYSIEVAYGVPASTIRTWASRGEIARHGHDARGRTLFDMAEVERKIGHQPLIRPAPVIRPGACLACDRPAVPGCPVPLCAPHLAAVRDFYGDS